MRLWHKDYSLSELTAMNDCFMTKHLGIEILALGDQYLSGRMPVDDRTRMPFGLLHGGASCVLAESLGSYASYLCIDPATQRMVGLEINANHIRGVKDGWVVGTVRPIHVGRSTHVWDIQIRRGAVEDAAAAAPAATDLVGISRLTVAVLDLHRSRSALK